jgi:hypothetical protein
MLSETLIEQLNELAEADKRAVVKLLLAQLPPVDAILPMGTYEVWSPYDSAAAADVLREMLAEDTQSHE